MAINIGMAFSGGGYRAATFNLGTLSFLNSVKLDDGKTLLDCVVALSSVSGGTIPAMKYMLTRARDESVDKMVEDLFNFLRDEDLVTHALNGLSQEKTNPEVSGIKIMARYGKELAEAERDYKVELRKEVLRLRSQGEAVTVIQQCVRGSGKVPELRFKRDTAQVMYDTARENINVLKLQSRLLEAQIDREWKA